METCAVTRLRAVAAWCAIVLLATIACGSTPVLAQLQDARTGQLAGRELQAASGAFSRGAPPPTWSSPPPANRGEPAFDGIAILHADSHFRVGQQPVVFISRIIQTYQASALAEIGQFSITFQPEYQKVELHSLRITRGHQVIDKLHGADIRFLQREQGLDIGILTGTVSAVVLVDDLRVGDVLEISYSLIGQNPVYGGKFVDAASWDSTVPIRFRRVTLDAGEDRNIQYRVIGSDQQPGFHPSEHRSNGRRILRFEATNLPAVAIDTFIPQDIQPQRWIQFSEFASWAEVARWAAELMAPPEPQPDLGPVLATVKGAATASEAAVKALGFVQDEIRYLSISLGENSHRPYPPAQVLSRRYGDCKDKSALLVATLKQLGIDAAPALVSLQSRKGLDKLLPSPLAFDHVIVRAVINNQIYFLDPTAWGQGRNLDRMGQIHAGAQYLLAAPGALVLDTVPVESGSQTVSSRIEHVSVEKTDGPAELRIRFEHSGLDAESIRRTLAQMTQEQMRKAYGGLLDRRYTGAVLGSGPDIEDNREENRVAVELKYRLPGFLESSNNDWVGRFRADNLLRLFYLPESANRRHALAIPGYPSVNRYEFEMTLPPEFDAQRRPSEQTVKSRAFLLTETSSFSGRTLKLSQEMRITADRIEAKEVPQFLSDLRNVERLLGGSLLVLRSDMKTRTAAPVSLEKSITQRLEKLLESTSAVIANAKLQGQDFSATLCERARALAYLGRNTEALADILEAVRQQPAAADLMKCSGEVRFTVGDFSRSIVDLSRALALQPRDSETRFFRGLSNYYLGKFPEAAQDFLAAGTLAQDATERIRPRIWYALTSRQLKTKEPDTDSPAEATGTWPAPALALLRLKRTPEDVLREVHRQSGERLDSSLAEAYLYVGQHFLLLDDPAQAGVFLKRATEKGALHSFFHAAARHELARFKNGSR